MDEKLASTACQRSGLILKIPARSKAPQLEAIEYDCGATSRSETDFGAPLTIDEMLDPSVENINEETI